MRRPKCICGAFKVDGLCPHGCEAHRKPSERYRKSNAASKRKEEEALKIGVTPNMIGWAPKRAKGA